MWWDRTLIPAIKRLREEECKFEASRGYIARPYLKHKQKKI
jgi:hypothetical protein